jgi:hypothetical protein
LLLTKTRAAHAHDVGGFQTSPAITTHCSKAQHGTAQHISDSNPDGKTTAAVGGHPLHKIVDAAYTPLHHKAMVHNTVTPTALLLLLLLLLSHLLKGSCWAVVISGQIHTTQGVPVTHSSTKNRSSSKSVTSHLKVLAWTADCHLRARVKCCSWG